MPYAQQNEWTVLATRLEPGTLLTRLKMHGHFMEDRWNHRCQLYGFHMFSSALKRRVYLENDLLRPGYCGYLHESDPQSCLLSAQDAGWIGVATLAVESVYSTLGWCKREVTLTWGWELRVLCLKEPAHVGCRTVPTGLVEQSLLHHEVQPEFWQTQLWRLFIW